MTTQRQQFVESVLWHMERDERIVVLLGDIGVAAFADARKRWPDRIINVGIAEQTLVSMAAGMAVAGKIPVVFTIAPFLVRRAYEQLCLDFGYQQLRGIFVTCGASFDYAALGSTHHCPDDVQLIDAIPGFDIYAPSSVFHVNESIRAALMNDNRSSYIRLTEKVSEPTQSGNSIGANVTAVAVGPMLGDVYEACGVGSDEPLNCNIVHWWKLHQPPEVKSDVRRILLVEPFYEGTMMRRLHEALACSVRVVCVGVRRWGFSPCYGTRADHEQASFMTVNDIRLAAKKLIGVSHDVG